MFKELHPLIQNRPLTITVAAIGDCRIRVNVVPQSLESDTRVNEKLGYSQPDKIAKVPESSIAALTTPLSLTGTPEDIDTELARTLSAFAESHVELQKTVEDAKEQIAAAIKDIQERQKNKSRSPASAAKCREKSDKTAANNELLPLWAKPPDDARVSPEVSEADVPSAVAPSAPAERSLNSNQTEVKS